MKMQPQLPDYIFAVDEPDFSSKVLEASRESPILVDLWADWCGPCHGLTPHLYKALEHFSGRIKLAKVEVDEGENMKIAGHYRVRGFPTVILFSEAQEIARFSGARATHWIDEWLREHLPILQG